MSSASGVCAACSRAIDAAAKLCPYCGANPQSGDRLDTQAILQEVFRPREVSTSDSVIEYARRRQGVFIAVSVFVGFLIIAVVHQFVTKRNANVATDLPAVPLTEITDVTKKSDDMTPVPMPNLDFQYNGSPQRMRTFVVERGAVPPPEVVAAQQPPVPSAQQPAQAAQPPQAAPRPQPPPTRP